VCNFVEAGTEEVPMFHDKGLGDSKAKWDALNYSRISDGLEPYQGPAPYEVGGLLTLLLVVAILTLLAT
jgi:hypothetical protein